MAIRPAAPSAPVAVPVAPPTASYRAGKILAYVLIGVGAVGGLAATAVFVGLVWWLL